MRVWLGIVIVMVVVSCAFHVLMLFCFFLIDRRLAQAALGRKMTYKVDNVPHLVVIQDALPSRHS